MINNNYLRNQTYRGSKQRKKFKKITNELRVIEPTFQSDASIPALKKKLLAVLSHYGNNLKFADATITPQSAANELLSFLECLSFDPKASVPFFPFKKTDTDLTSLLNFKKQRSCFLIMRKAAFVKNTIAAKRRYKNACPYEADGIYGIAKYSLVVLYLLNADMNYYKNIQKLNNADMNYYKNIQKLKYSVYENLVSLYNSLCWQVECYCRSYQKNSCELYFDFIHCICNLILAILGSKIYEEKDDNI